MNTRSDYHSWRIESKKKLGVSFERKWKILVVPILERIFKVMEKEERPNEKDRRE